MKIKLQKWENNLALRIPKAFADELGLAEHDTVELAVQAGQLIIKPARPYTLDDLLAGITHENRHAELDWGSPLGNEVW